MGRILFDEENEFGKLRCFVQDGGYGFLVIAGEEFSAAVYDYSPKSAESLALALLDDLGKGWKPYPENKPEWSSGLMTQYPVTVKKPGIKPYVCYLWFYNGKFESLKFGELDGFVVAYKEKDAPYQPEEQ